jgi:hypothetical protein
MYNRQGEMDTGKDIWRAPLAVAAYSWIAHYSRESNAVA